MKIAIALLVALAVIGTVAAQRRANAGPTITDYLIRRGMMLEHTIQYDLFRLDQKGEGYKGGELRNLLTQTSAYLQSLYGGGFDEVTKGPVEQEWARLEALVAEQQAAVGLNQKQRK